MRMNSIFKRLSTAGGGQMIEYNTLESLLVAKAGYMQKKSPSRLLGWQTRYFVLRGDLLMLYYIKEQEHRCNELPKGSINLALIPKEKISEYVVISDAIVRINIQNRMYELSCTRKDIAQEWLDCIVREISTSTIPT